MSDPNTQTGAATSAATTTGAASAVPGGGASGAAGAAGATPSGDDYTGKIRTNPDFAVDQVKSHQQRADRVTEELRQLKTWVGGLSPYQQQGLSGDALAAHLSDYLEVAQRPEGQKLLQRLRQGEPVPDTTRDTPEEYLTDEEKEIRTLKTQVQRLESRLTGQDANLGQQALIRHVGQVATEWGLTDAHKEKLLSGLSTQVSTWAKQGETGLAAIRNLSGPDGHRTVEMLLPSVLGREGLSEAMKAQLLRDQKVRRSLQTDSPSGVVPQNAEPPPQFKSALDALRYAQEHPEVLRVYDGG